MDFTTNRTFGQTITTLIAKENLPFEQAHDSFCKLLNNSVSEMQQGAFLAALTAKGETADEVAAGWKAVYELDTNKVSIQDTPMLVENCGTGMDTFKTFNISTAASIIAAAGGVAMARHGARAISSTCGTVDMAEQLGVDVECDVDLVAHSVKTAGIGLFNGMSTKTHPKALGRILSQIAFGSPLNIAASLANPALPQMAVRGVYCKELLLPVLQVMQAIGYRNALVIHGTIDGSDLAMDEASVCGPSFGAMLKDDTINEFVLNPEQFGLTKHSPDALRAVSNKDQAARELLSILSGKSDGAKLDIVLLNTALIFYISQKTTSIKEGIRLAQELIENGAALEKLEKWVVTQNREPESGIARLKALLKSVNIGE